MSRPRRLAVLVGLSALAFTQPLLATFGASPETLVILQVDALVAIAVVVMIALAPPLAAWGVEILAEQIHPKLGVAAQVATVGILAGLALSLILQPVIGSSPITMALCLLVGGWFGNVVRSSPALSEWLSYLAVGQIVFAGVFFLASPGGSVVSGETVEPPDGPVGAATTPIVVVILDELPTSTLLDGSGEVDGATYPGFARLAESSTWYRNATTVAPNTTQAVPAVLTGQNPPGDERAPIAGDHPENLFVLLGETHEPTSFEQITRLCPSNLCPVVRTASRFESFRAFADLLVPTYGDILADSDSTTLLVDPPFDTEAPARFEDFTTQLEAGTGTLDVLHALYPHGPFLYAGDGTRYDAPYVPRGLFSGNWFDDASAVLGRQRHQEQVRSADRQLGQLIDRLVEVGRYDETLIVVVADHGVSFIGGEPSRGASDANQVDIAWVPLFIKYPDQVEAVVDDRPARVTDVVPTIADVIGATAPWTMDGISLLGAARPEDAAVLLADWELSTLDHGDDPVELDGARGFAELLSAETLNPAVLGPGSAFALVPGSEVILGRPVDELEVGTPIAEPGILEDRYADRSWDGSEPAPLYLSGSITRPPAEPLAVAVDGSIVAVVPTSIFRGFDETGWWTLLPREAVVEGAHALDLYLVEGDVADPVLRPVPLEVG